LRWLIKTNWTEQAEKKEGRPCFGFSSNRLAQQIQIVIGLG